jgi:hypothetical protein
MMNLFALYPDCSRHWVLHATRSGQFDVYVSAVTALEFPKKVISLEDHAAFIEWLKTSAPNELQPHSQAPHLWRILADMADPITCCLTVPELSRRDQRDFLNQRLNTHHPSASWRYCELHHDKALLLALPDSPKLGSHLKPLLEALISAGQQIEALVTPGQLLSHFSNKDPAELMISRSPQGTLVALYAEGRFRFSRWLPQAFTPDLLSTHLLPTLLTHHLVARNQALQIHELADELYPDQLIAHLAYARRRDIPTQLKGIALDIPGKFKFIPTRNLFAMLTALILSLTLACLSYGWIALQEANQAESALTELQGKTSITQAAKIPDTWPALDAYQKRNTCPDLFGITQALSETLNSHPDIQIERIRWECLHEHQPAQLSLSIQISDDQTSHYLSLNNLLEDLRQLGETDAKPQSGQKGFLIHLHIPAKISPVMGKPDKQGVSK